MIVFLAILQQLAFVALVEAAEESLSEEKQAAFVGLPENPYANDGQLACGPRCVAFALSFFNHPANYADVLKECPPGPMGTTLKNLSDVVESHGLHTAAFSGATIGDLQQLRFPAIVHVKRNRDDLGHFLTIVGWNKDRDAFLAYSPPDYYGYLPVREIRGKVTGLGFAISDSALPPVEKLIIPEFPLFRWCLVSLLSIVSFILAAANFYATFGGGPAACGPAPVPPPALSANQLAPLFLTAIWLAGCGAEETSRGLEAGARVDLGTILAGQPLRHTFTIVNNSTAQFRLIDVEKSCSCQLVSFDQDKTLATGASTALTVEVPTKGHHGKLEYQFTLHTDSSDAAWRDIPLKLTVDVRAKFKVHPSRLVFGNVLSGQRAATRLQITAAEGNVEQLFSGFELRQGTERLKVHAIPDAPRATVEYDLVLDPDAPLGDVDAKLVLHFNDKDVPEIEVPIFGRIEGNLLLTPGVVVANHTSGATRIVKISAADHTPFTITGIENNTPISVEQLADQQNDDIRYRIELKEGIDSGRYSVIFLTSSPQQPSITLPVIVH